MMGGNEMKRGSQMICAHLCSNECFGGIDAMGVLQFENNLI